MVLTADKFMVCLRRSDILAFLDEIDFFLHLFLNADRFRQFFDNMVTESILPDTLAPGGVNVSKRHTFRIKQRCPGYSGKPAPDGILEPL